MASKLTWDQEVILVNEIKKYGVLFDNRHKHFRNLNKRERVWEKICEKIGLPHCKHRWGYLRGQYVKKKRMGVEKWEYGRNSGCNYMEILSFLSNTNDSDAYPEEAPIKKKKKDKKKENRKHHINDDDTLDVSENKEHQKDYQMNDDTEEFEENKYYNEDDTDGWQNNENYITYDTDGSKKKKRKKKHLANNATDDMEQKKQKEEDYAEDNTDNEFHVRHKTAKIQDIATPVKQNSNVLEPLDESVKGNMSIYNDTLASYKSPTHKFFETMADFVEKLPADLQARIRQKVCHIVTDMEIKHHKLDVGEPRDSFSQSYDQLE